VAIGKGLLALAIAALVAGGVFAQARVSVGGGVAFNGGSLGGMSVDYRAIKGPKVSNSVSHVGLGGFVFLDAVYAELSLGFGGGPLSVAWKEQPENPYSRNGRAKIGSFTALDIGLLGKFPIALGDGRISVFPLFGFAYSMVVGIKDNDGKKMFESEYGDYEYILESDLDNYRLQFGVGTDLGISDNLYLRIQGLGHYRFANKYFKYMAKEAELESAGSNYGRPDIKAKATGGFGATVAFAVGYKF